MSTKDPNMKVIFGSDTKDFEKGAQAVILGCTELGLLLKQGDSELPFYDTTLIHARQAALRSLE